MPESPQYPPQVTFSRGEVSPYLFGRVDLSTYLSSLRTLRNAFVRPEGAVSNRPGFNYIGPSGAPTGIKTSILIPFQFSATQSYVIELSNLIGQVYANGSLLVTGATVNITAISIQYYTSGPRRIYYFLVTTATPHGLLSNQRVNISGIIGTADISALNANSQIVAFIVNSTQFALSSPYRFGIAPQGVYTSGGTIVTPFTFVTPWLTADLWALRWSQSADTLTVVHPNYPPQEILRVSGSTFTCTAGVYNNGPFLPENADGTTFVYATASSGNTTLVSSQPIFNANHVGGLFLLRQQDISSIPPWEGAKSSTTSSSWVGQQRRSYLKNYLCTSSVQVGGTPYATGTIAPSHSQGTQPDGDGTLIPVVGYAGMYWQYKDSGYGIVRITGFTDSTHVTGIVQPNYPGGGGNMPSTVSGGTLVINGPWTFSGTGSQTSFGPMTGSGSTDPTNYYATIGGVYQNPSTYSIVGHAIVFVSAPPVGTNNVVAKEISSLRSTTYWAFGAFSMDQGFPSAVTYFPDRLIFAATTKQPVGVWGSKTSNYHDFGVSTPIIASDAFGVYLNARQLNAISDLIPVSDLLVGTSSIIWRLWPGSTGVALSPLAISANPQSYYGESPNCAAILFGDSAVFPEYDGRRIRDLIYQFAYDKFTGQELTLYSRHLVPLGTTIIRLAYKPDAAAPFIYALRSDGVLLCCTYLRDQQVIGWARWDTQGTFEDICVIQENNSFALYAIVSRTINGVVQRGVERLANREVLTTFDYQFLDCSLTYDGRNTSASISMTLTGGTLWMSGDTGTLTVVGSTPFSSNDPAYANEIWLYDAAGNLCRVLITSFTSSTVVSVRLKDPAPVTLQGISTTTWSFARTTFSGVLQLANMPVVALAAGMVIGMQATGTAPDGSLSIDAGGFVTLPQAYPVVQIGLPYLTDFETLSLNIQGQQTIRMISKSEPVVHLDVTESRNLLAGNDFTNMNPHVERDFEPYISSSNMNTGVTWVRMNSILDAECHTCIRQNMPLPITIRMVIPQVAFGSDIS